MFPNETSETLEFHDFSLVPDLNKSESEMIPIQKKSLPTSPRIMKILYCLDSAILGAPAKAYG